MWTYHQQSGELLHDGAPAGFGYSGSGLGKNNPAMQDQPSVGPIPRGRYTIGKRHDTPTHGPCVMVLTPAPGTDTFGRDGFLIHGDSKQVPGTASLGCIILSRTIRDQIGGSGDTELEVLG